MAKTENAVEMRAADSDSSLDGFHGSSEDAKDMYRLGRSQELKVCCVARMGPCQILEKHWLTGDRETSIPSPFSA
jgi:hypothetical protein